MSLNCKQVIFNVLKCRLEELSQELSYHLKKNYNFAVFVDIISCWLKNDGLEL